MEFLVFAAVDCPHPRPLNPHQMRVAAGVSKTLTLRWWELVGEVWRVKGGACVMIVSVFVIAGCDEHCCYERSHLRGFVCVLYVVLGRSVVVYQLFSIPGVSLESKHGAFGKTCE